MEPLRISVEELVQRLSCGEFTVLVDARPAQYWDATDFKLPGAVRMPPDDVATHLDLVASWHPIVTYCCLPHEAASMQVARELHKYNRLLARPLRGGIAAWCEAGFPVQPK